MSALNDCHRGESSCMHRSHAPTPETKEASAANTTFATEAQYQKKSTNSGATEFTNLLAHVEGLEKQNKDLQEHNKKLETELKSEQARSHKLSERTREDMQAILDSMYDKWINKIEVDAKDKEKDKAVKEFVRCGMNKFVDKSDDANGIWRLMVAASAHNQRQVHDLDQLKTENQELKLRLDGRYSSVNSRVGDKRPASDHLDRSDELMDSANHDIWTHFAQTIQNSDF